MTKEFPTQGNAQMNNSNQLVVEVASGSTIDKPVANITIVDVSNDNDVVVTDSPAVVYGYYIDTVLSAQAVIIKDNEVVKVTIPASAAAGTSITLAAPISCATNIKVESNDAATGKVGVIWRAA